MHGLLKSQLQQLGLNNQQPPTAEEWQGFLAQVSHDYFNLLPLFPERNLQQQLNEAILLNHVIAAVTSSSETNQILHIICRELSMALDLPRATCTLLNRDTTHLTVVAEYRKDGSKISAVGNTIPIADNPAPQLLIKHKEPLVISNVLEDERLAATRHLSEKHGTRAMLLLPLLVKDNVIGTIGLNDTKLREFKDDEVRLARHVAAAASQALENAQLYEDLQTKLLEQARAEKLLRHQNEYLNALHETALGLVDRLDATSLIETILKRAAKLLGTEHGFLYVASAIEDDITLRAGIGIFHQSVGNRLKPGEGLSGKAWAEGQTIVVDDYRRWYGQESQFGRVSGAVSVPLRSGDKQSGVIGLVYRDEERTFTAEEIELLERFAQLASVALDNALLYSAARQEISERIQTEYQLQTAKEIAESANRAKSTFLARMSHELRTPLNAIIGYSDILSEEAQDFGVDELVPDIRRIRQSAMILLEIISDILDISKIEAGETNLYLEIFDIHNLIEDILDIAHPLIIKNDNRLVQNLAPAMPPLYADITKLRQSIFNILSNAAKFTVKGNICLTTRLIMLNSREMVEIEVRDTGIGITREKHDTVFEPFVQEDDSTTRRFGGTGLGLAISRHYCRLMGGDILLDSRANEGSIFTIRVPVSVRDGDSPLTENSSALNANQIE